MSLGASSFELRANVAGWARNDANARAVEVAHGYVGTVDEEQTWRLQLLGAWEVDEDLQAVRTLPAYSWVLLVHQAATGDCPDDGTGLYGDAVA